MINSFLPYYFIFNYQMSKTTEHLKWCRWCDFVKSKSSRKRHEESAHSFEKEETKKMADLKRTKSFRPPTGYIWCTACTVLVENTVSGVSNHSNSMYHKSNSGRPLHVVSNSISVVSITSIAAAPQPQISRRLPEVQERTEDSDDAFEYSAHEQSGACLLLFYFLLLSFSLHAQLSLISQNMKQALEALLIPIRNQKWPCLPIELAQKK